MMPCFDFIHVPRVPIVHHFLLPYHSPSGIWIQLLYLLPFSHLQLCPTQPVFFMILCSTHVSSSHIKHKLVEQTISLLSLYLFLNPILVWKHSGHSLLNEKYTSGERILWKKWKLFGWKTRKNKISFFFPWLAKLN